MHHSTMKTFTHKTSALVLAILLTTATQFAFATPESNATTCEAKAVSKDGKPLHGAAKSAFMAKCNKDHQGKNCEDKAVDKNGKKLAGAAKASFMKKCQANS